MELWTAFLIGLLGSLHCVGMCGPIALALPYQAKTRSLTILNVLLYNVGRITTYAIIGLLPGLLGLGLALSGFQRNVSLTLGIVFFVAALFSLGFFRSNHQLPIFEQFYQGVQKRLSNMLGSKKRYAFYTIGFVNGFLPCGLIYMALAGALVQFDLLGSMSYMIFFGLGTIPLMLLVATSQQMISGGMRRVLRKSTPFFMLFMSALLIYRGLFINLPDAIDSWFMLGSVPMCD
jgi:sulfite exporter TauE/SafE